MRAFLMALALCGGAATVEAAPLYVDFEPLALGETAGPYAGYAWTDDDAYEAFYIVTDGSQLVDDGLRISYTLTIEDDLVGGFQFNLSARGSETGLFSKGGVSGSEPGSYAGHFDVQSVDRDVEQQIMLFAGLNIETYETDSFSYSDVTVTLSPVPLPPAALLLGAPLLALWGVRRRSVYGT